MYIYIHHFYSNTVYLNILWALSSQNERINPTIIQNFTITTSFYKWEAEDIERIASLETNINRYGKFLKYLEQTNFCLWQFEIINDIFKIPEI